MKVHRFHSWDVTPAEAIQIQQRIRERVVRRSAVLDPEFVAGADAAFDIEAQRVYAAVVVLRFPRLEPVETVVTASRLIGAAVRTRDKVRPVFVSIGHKIGLAEAVRLTLACGKGYRLPEPTRQADLLAGQAKREMGFQLKTSSKGTVS